MVERHDSVRKAVVESGSWRDRTPKTGVMRDWETEKILKKSCAVAGVTA